MAWMRLSEYLQQQGENIDMINKRIKRGHWLRDVHLHKPKGSKWRWVNLEAVADWAAGKQPTHLHGRGAK